MKIDAICPECNHLRNVTYNPKVYKDSPFDLDGRYVHLCKRCTARHNSNRPDVLSHRREVQKALWNDPEHRAMRVQSILEGKERTRDRDRQRIIDANPIKKLTYEEEQILLGSLLGDGCLNRRRFSPWYCEGHSEVQEEYLLWKSDMFHRFGCRVQYSVARAHGRFTKDTNQVYLGTRSFPTFIPYYEAFYPEGTKVAPREWLDKIDPLGLAIWFLDDGSTSFHVSKTEARELEIKHSSANATFSTNGFPLADVEVLQEWLESCYGIGSVVTKTDRPGQFILYLNAESMEALHNIIRPVIQSLPIPTMYYKIDRGLWLPKRVENVRSRSRAAV